MKIIVTHMSPDWDAISSVWLIKKYLAGWQEAKVAFVPAGQRLNNMELKLKNKEQNDPIERTDSDEIIHVDTGLGPLDHHQTQDTDVSAASVTWDYVRESIEKSGSPLRSEHNEAISRIIKIVVDTDHFKEVFWPDAAADRYELSFLGLLDGLKYEKPNEDMKYVEFGFVCLDAWVAEFENRIWAEKEIKEKGVKFDTRFGNGMGFETLNDTVLKLAQKMGYVLVIRKDPRKGYVRIKALPVHGKEKGADLTLAYEQLKKIDPDATWFLHVSKKMLLNGSPKNPKMRPTKLSLNDIIKVVEKI
jgi:hypothetical protein